MLYFKSGAKITSNLSERQAFFQKIPKKFTTHERPRKFMRFTVPLPTFLQEQKPI